MKAKRKQTKLQVSVPISAEIRFLQIIKPFVRNFSALTVALWVREFGTETEKEIAELKIKSIRKELGL